MKALVLLIFINLIFSTQSFANNSVDLEAGPGVGKPWKEGIYNPEPGVICILGCGEDTSSGKKRSSSQPRGWVEEQVIVKAAPAQGQTCPADMPTSYYDLSLGWTCAKFEWKKRYYR